MNGNGEAFYGKYRGVVTDNNDPLSIGRIRARVQDVYGELESGWATAAAPFGGNHMGFFAVPDGAPVSGSSSNMAIPTIPSGAAAGGALRAKCLLSSDSREPESVDHDQRRPQHPARRHVRRGRHHPENIRRTEDRDQLAMGSKSTNGSGASIKLSNNKVSINGNALEVE